MKITRFMLAGIVILIALSAGTWLAYGQTFNHQITSREGDFNIHLVDFDYKNKDGSPTPTPHIPKDWRLVSVEHFTNIIYGTRSEQSRLWFQAPTGSVYMVVGYVQDSNLTVAAYVNHLQGEKVDSSGKP